MYLSTRTQRGLCAGARTGICTTPFGNALAQTATESGPLDSRFDSAQWKLAERTVWVNT
jgi:hypothetical protein